MNIIIGSGLNAFLARHILGPEYKIIGAGPSRFYNVNPASTDNFIYASEMLQPLEEQLRALNIDTTRYPYQCCWSNNGELSGGFDRISCSFWLSKVFGLEIPAHLELVYPHRMNFEVYGTRVNQLYAALYKKYYPEMASSKNISDIESIRPHQIVFKDGQVLDFENCISTIPLDDLCNLMDYQLPLSGIDVSAILVETSSLDFEGYNQVFVVDPEIKFFKATQIKEDGFIFYFINKIDNPGLYMTPYMNDFDLVSGFYYENCIPAGAISETSWLSKFGVIPLGMSAQWDAAMDVSSCLHRIMKIADGSVK
jgi:hypothetical protein